MSSELFAATKFALSGIVVGATVAKVGDLVFDYLVNAAMPTAPVSSGGNYGRSAFVLVGGSAVVATSLLAGDKLMNMIGGTTEDPLYHAIFYNVAMTSSSTAGSVAGLIRTVIGRLAAQAQPMPAPGSTATTTSCSSGTCSQ